ncbi:unnamed protein product [Prorocentrum cordatum]|uniref:Uncharacterized protein n=1 Tax=Prorocentrum cordatum TaxID=2364126 RepID=A0ABN9U1P8_9DINO|nr:unnamed protein product [Polarella glacialis]
MAFLRVLHENNWWHKANDAWICGLLPQGGLVRFKATGEMMFIVKAYSCAALCWPAEEESPGMWRKAKDCASLVWKVVFGEDEVEIFPCSWKSPIRLFTEDFPWGAEAFV